MSEASYYVYILTNWNHQVMYVGSTKDLKKRVEQHRAKKKTGFTHKYRVTKLVYFEKVSGIKNGLRRERQIKEWRRAWKNELVATLNPTWRDLIETI
ncbi:MAG: GIY-YIG nuclease family protein [Candidatus Moranbacteria bacterium]|nr:GIY-YIG nuclease family protein [Candidatus Moranbacteria bacterium]